MSVNTASILLATSGLVLGWHHDAFFTICISL